ncbi:MAG: hypothetical protein K6E50_14545 [Lachnospiraceae bacterium]|nr:hypothetical protein [Lachnospiraceae bacterium]
MKLSDETYEEIKQAVADMLVDYDIKGIPLFPFEVADKKNRNKSDTVFQITHHVIAGCCSI